MSQTGQFDIFKTFQFPYLNERPTFNFQKKKKSTIYFHKIIYRKDAKCQISTIYIAIYVSIAMYKFSYLFLFHLPIPSLVKLLRIPICKYIY